MYDKTDCSNEPYPHRHLWQECADKDKKSGKTQTVEKCKFCHIVREKKK